jgi:serine/threonine protein kinase
MRSRRSNTYMEYMQTFKGVRMGDRPPYKKWVQYKNRSSKVSVLKTEGLRDDMSVKELCAFLCENIPFYKLGYNVGGIIGAGSYGVVLSLKNKDGKSCVCKITRISSTKGPIIRFPVINNQKTSWHTISPKEFKRGSKAQKTICEKCKFVRVPSIYHVGCVKRAGSSERFGVVIMEKIRGVTLRKVLQSEKVSARTKSSLVKKAANIISNFHSVRLVHGDNHAWNYLCDSSGHLYSIDFDRTCVSREPKNRLHDLGMFMDTVDHEHWQTFLDSYFGTDGSSNPFRFKSSDPATQKKELHKQSRMLFRKYLDFLRS